MSFIQDVQVVVYSGYGLVQKTAKKYSFTSHKLDKALQEIEIQILKSGITFIPIDNDSIHHRVESHIVFISYNSTA
jgi:hypothetical protein